MAEPRVQEMFKVFFVDSGVSADVSSSYMADCRVEFVERLPFHAVRCSLAQVGPVGKEWSSEVGDKLFEITRDLDTDEALVLEYIVVEKLSDSYRVKLRNGLNLAQDLVQERLADWLDSSLESSMDTIEQDFEQKSGRGNREEDPEWDIPEGLPEDVLDMEELYDAAKEGCEQYLEDQLGPVLGSTNHPLLPTHRQSQSPPPLPSCPQPLSHQTCPACPTTW